MPQVRPRDPEKSKKNFFKKALNKYLFTMRLLPSLQRRGKYDSNIENTIASLTLIFIIYYIRLY